MSLVQINVCGGGVCEEGGRREREGDGGNYPEEVTHTRNGC